MNSDTDPARARALGLLATFFLVLSSVQFARYALATIRFPYGLFYTEGEVWQQALLIPGPAMYGDIKTYPYIGFEYPPLYHLVVNSVSPLFDGFLAAGRTVSLAACCIAALAGAMLCHAATRDKIASTVAALLPFTMLPVFEYAVLTGVDMLGLMFALLALALAALALRRPVLLHGAVLCCVAAVFCKPTFLAAPGAISIVWLLRAPGRAVRSLVIGASVGVVATLWLTEATGGGFLRHVFIYNINRFQFENLVEIGLESAGPACLVIVLAAVGAVLTWRELTLLQSECSLIADIRASDQTAVLCLLSIWLWLALCEAMLAGKIGASRNYFIDFLFACAVWTGVLAGRRLPAPLPMLVSGLVVVQSVFAFTMLSQAREIVVGPAAAARQAQLVQLVRQADGPVLSDDLALLLVAGKIVPIEPFIFAELSAAGRWDDTNLRGMVHRHEFAAVITEGDPGDYVFDQRFRPDVAAEIERAYPRVRAVGNIKIRRAD